MSARTDRIASELRSIARTATAALDHLDDLEALGAHIDDIAEDLQTVIEAANTSEKG